MKKGVIRINILEKYYFTVIVTIGHISSLVFGFVAIITFFYIHKKKVLDSRKFSTSGFR